MIKKNVDLKKPLAIVFALSMALGSAYSFGRDSSDGFSWESFFSFEEEKKEPKKDSAGQVDIEVVKKRILVNIQALDPGVLEIKLEESPVPGVYWVLLPGNETLLVSEDGQYILGRGLSQFKGDKVEVVESEVLKTAMANRQKEVTDDFVNLANTQVVYKAIGEKVGEVHVFTDVNCGYCRKFHRDVPELNGAGIEVRYFAGPFFSKDRESLEKIWCSESPMVAMTEVKDGQKLSGVSISDECRATVSRHITLGQKLGIRGTPAIFLKTGEQVGGYLPPDQLIAKFK